MHPDHWPTLPHHRRRPVTRRCPSVQRQGQRDTPNGLEDGRTTRQQGRRWTPARRRRRAASTSGQHDDEPNAPRPTMDDDGRRRAASMNDKALVMGKRWRTNAPSRPQTSPAPRTVLRLAVVRAGLPRETAPRCRRNGPRTAGGYHPTRPHARPEKFATKLAETHAFHRNARRSSRIPPHQRPNAPLADPQRQGMLGSPHRLWSPRRPASKVAHRRAPGAFPVWERDRV